MINLLFISNNPRIELVRERLQQTLKMRIEGVEDFDQGLKDVFEKRPAVVCIQEQIGGVAGESVARHIQLLLGKGASAFILMHEGNPKARAVPGLFDHLVDLSEPFEMVCESLLKSLQVVLGGHWTSVYNAPLGIEPGFTPASSSDASQTDQLVEGFIAENSIFNPQNAVPLPGQIVETALKPDPVFEHDLPGGPPAELHASKVSEAEQKPVQSADTGRPELQESSATTKPAFVTPESSKLPSPVKPELFQSIAVPVQIEIETAGQQSEDVDESTVPVEQLLQEFEANYTARRRLLRWSSIGAILLVFGGLAFFAIKLYVLPSKSSPAKIQAPPLTQKPKVMVQQPASTMKVQPVVSATIPIPSFIPKEGFDPAFSAKKPGWSRYLSPLREYRLFQSEGRLRALQVLARGNGVITDKEFRQVLHELTGSNQYRPVRQGFKDGLYLERAVMSDHAELAIYHSTKNGPIKAFVFAPTP